MMISSTGKSMTTMMMATLVDNRKMGWETPAVRILPSFAVSDPGLTPKITMRHLVCNCNGVERRDVEMFFPTRPRTDGGVIESVRGFFAGTFGKACQYSNQMYEAGGYIAARAAGAGTDDPYADYLAQMRRRIFSPIGMTSTTFSFTSARSNPNHATPMGGRLTCASSQFS